MPAPFQVPLSDEEKQAQEQKPEKLAIGGDKGFQVDGPTENTVKRSELVLLSGGSPVITVPLPCNDLPELILNAIKAVQVNNHHARCCFDNLFLLTRQCSCNQGLEDAYLHHCCA